MVTDHLIVKKTTKPTQVSTLYVHVTMATYSVLGYIILVAAYLNAVVCIRNSDG